MNNKTNLNNFIVDVVHDLNILTTIVLTKLEGEIYDDVSPYSDLGIEMFKQWCNEQSVYFYARPHEVFNKMEAIELAVSSGRTYLLMEDLS